ncbi:MAG: hypothetical protein NVS1B10_06220 [Candidatus Saccharimonadales bacterium]
MIQFGSETTITTDANGQVEETNHIADYDTRHKLKKISRRIKVHNKQDETTEYLKFSKLMHELRDKKILAVNERDHTTRPSFVLLFPKTDIDGSYFVIVTYTELMI